MLLRDLEAFVVLAAELHFGRAARQLHMDVSSLSRHLRTLEHDLGTPLVARTSHHVSLTLAGELLSRRAPSLLEQADEIDRVVRSALGVGQIRIGHTNLISGDLLAQVLAWIRSQWPELRVRLRAAASPRLLQELEAGKLDVAFVRAAVVADGLGAIGVMALPLVVALPPHHDLVALGEVEVASVVGEPLVVPSGGRGSELRSTTVDLCRSFGRELLIAAEANDATSLLAIVAAGYGPAIVPAYFGSRPPPHGVVLRPFAAPKPSAPVIAAWRLDDTSIQLSRLLDELPKLLNSDLAVFEARPDALVAKGPHTF